MARLQQDQDLSIPGFLGRDFAKSRDPRIFQDGIVLNFLSRDFTKKVWYLGISSWAHRFGHFDTFWRTSLFVKYIRQTKVSSIPPCGKQQERASVQCGWQHGDPKRVCLVSTLVCLETWAFGIRSKWEVNVWLIDWFLLPSLNQSMLVHVEYWLMKNKMFTQVIFDPSAAIKGLTSLSIQSFKGSWKSRKIPGLDFWESRDRDFEKIPGSGFWKNPGMPQEPARGTLKSD